jgi:6,7-dimethyl-8-ribityllumazine synthase
MPRSFEGDLNAEGLRFGVLASRFNDEIVDGLLTGALDCLVRHGAADDAIDVFRVPGAFELPMLANELAHTYRYLGTSGDVTAHRNFSYDALVTLGCLLRGDTPHFDFISSQVTNELSRVSVATRLPIAYGVITCNTLEQAVQRSSPGAGNKGWEAALAAIEMANLFRNLKAAAIRVNQDKA